MRALQSLVGSLSLAGLIACGGGSHPVIIDVPIPPDMPVDAFACTPMMGANIDTTANGPLDFATDFTGGPVVLTAMPVGTPPVLEFGINISGLFKNLPNTTLLMIWSDKKGVFAPPSATTAGNFASGTTGPVVGLYNLDDDANFGAGFDIVTYLPGTMGPDTSKPVQAYVLGNMGTAKFNLTAWDTKAVANGTSKFNGEYTGDMMAGLNIDPASGMTLGENMCSMMVTKLGFANVAVKWPATLPTAVDPRDRFSRFPTVQVANPVF
jgi:hypothetical protein